MAKHRDDIWKKDGTTGIFSLPTSSGGYLADPDFVDAEWLSERFSDPGLKGIIIRGSGRHFSAGADLEKLRLLAKNENLLISKMTAGKKILDLIENTPLPVIAEIRGACFGGGMEIALACHIRICSENALFAFPESNLGIMPGLGGSVRLSRIVGPGKAAEIMLNGDVINAEKALEMRLVEQLVAGKELHEYILKYMEKLTGDRDVEVIRAIMQSIHNSQHLPTDEALEEETRLFCKLAARNLGQ